MNLFISGIIVLCALFIPQAFGESLQNTELHGDSAVISLDIVFGADKYQQLLYKTLVHPQLDNINLKFYGDEFILSNPELKVSPSGEHFRILSIDEGMIMYGHKNLELNNYEINIYFTTNKGLTKLVVFTDIPLDDDKVAQTILPEIKNQYQPELLIVPSHDFKTYWKQDFKLDIQTFDAKINPSGTGFEGKLDGVDITAIISLDDEILATLKGVTEYGVWSSEYYIKENLVDPGEYTIDIIASYLGQTVSKSSSMFIIGSVIGDGSSKHAPIAIAGNDATSGSPATLDGSASSDSDGDVLTYSWVELTSNGAVIDDSTAVTTTFTGAVNVYTFELTVTDTTGRTDTDTVTITVT